MKRDVIYYIFVLLLTSVYFTDVDASEKTPMAIGEFQGGIQQKVVLTVVLIDFATNHSGKYQIITADSFIKSVISRYQTEFAAGNIPKMTAQDLENISAELILIPKADLFGDTYVLTAEILELRTFAVKGRYIVEKNGGPEILLGLVKELWLKIEPSETSIIIPPPYRYRGIEEVPLD
ncbi:hypothetical protein THIOM_001307 [Candidatus Thiomargarita nelsonii]|uniref:Uncharacterized protein n=1 Tax=Candidatus Thiomargarita nelsonii TaxID=1003181 RepID=A0A176S432_9GAMM|nr:hypothetical protein THIOM_001307 [Candidatus Thiomargarita nelsonii]